MLKLKEVVLRFAQPLQLQEASIFQMEVRVRTDMVLRYFLVLDIAQGMIQGRLHVDLDPLDVVVQDIRVVEQEARMVLVVVLVVPDPLLVGNLVVHTAPWVPCRREPWRTHMDPLNGKALAVELLPRTLTLMVRIWVQVQELNSNYL